MIALGVALGGFIGAIARYGTSRFFQGIGKPGSYATVFVNLLGSFVIGLAAHAAWLNPSWHSFLIIGFLGAYTTFSTFVLDAVEMVEKGRMVQSLLYIGASLIGGILMFGIGWSL